MDQVFTMTSVRDGFQLCRARICGFAADAECQCRGLRWRRSPGCELRILPRGPAALGCRSGTAGQDRALLVPKSSPRSCRLHSAVCSPAKSVPQQLLEAKCVFTLMKDTLPSGTYRLQFKYRRYRFLGISQVMADGSVITVAGSVEPPSRKTLGI
jgi:hypothetical protein